MPFYPGDPNINRKGRPKKGKTLTELIEKELLKKDVKTSTGEVISRREAIARVLTNQAVSGDYQSLKLVLEYIDGKPVKEVKVDATITTPTVVLTSEIEEDVDKQENSPTPVQE